MNVGVVTMNRVKAILAVVSLAIVTLPNSGYADAESCKQVMKHNLRQSFKATVPEVTDSMILSEICLNSKKPKGSSFRFNGTVKFSAAQLKASQALLCDKKGKGGRKASAKKNYSKHRVLKEFIGTEALNEYEKCVVIDSKGVKISAASDTESNKILNISVKLDRPDIKVEGITVFPPQALTCNGPIALNANDRHFTFSALSGSCERNPLFEDISAVVTVHTSVGNLNINLAPVSLNDNIAVDRINPGMIPQIPAVSGCNIFSQANRILECNTANGLSLCYHHLRAGRVVDCRAAFLENISPYNNETQFRPRAGEYQSQRSGGLSVTVYRGRPDDGEVRGAIDYTINFNTPVLAQRSGQMCDPSCPLFGNSPCNRDCVFADHIVEDHAHGGVATYGREQGNSCTLPLTGQIQPTSIEKYRAYNLCESRNTWGRNTQGVLYAQVSKSYYFNDFRTTHVVFDGTRNGRLVHEENWRVINSGERVRGIAELSIPIRITCVE